jgi:tRNA 5-methylaminomethyl-2-thiouridine biosynthesis bifunctional protein
LTPWFDYPPQQWREKHAIVVGAGIAGCQISWHLSRLGWQVTLLESQSKISTQASGNLAGIISPLMSAKPTVTEQFYLDAFEYTTQHLKQLIAAGDEIDWFVCGVLQLMHSERDKQRWNSLQTRNLDTKLIQFVDRHQATKTSGSTCDHPANYFPTAGFVNPESWCKALIKDAGIEVITDSEVSSFNYTANNSWSLYDNDGGLIASAEVVVMSTGRNLNHFTQSDHLELSNVLGQTTTASTNTVSADLKCAVNHEGYVTPSYQNKHVFGATYNREFEDVRLDKNSDLQNFRQLAEHLPELAKSFHEIRSGHVSVRSASPDRLPYVGGLPDTHYYNKHYASLKDGNRNRTYPKAQYLRGLFVLGGLGSRGLTSSALCAKILSEIIDNNPSTKSLSLLRDLHPSRFLIRQLRRGKA